ncbi:MAG: DUF6519 domain-containing protein [Anaerolineales bacterium]|jgi:hypothetical protein
MKGDFSRSTFSPEKHFTSVRMQQGRVQLDADWNEQADILNHLLTSQAMDVIGQMGGIADAFMIATGPPDGEDAHPAITITAGRYYVDGVMCVNDGDAKTSTNFADQPNLPTEMVEEDLEKLSASKAALVYLDVWQHHITMHEDPDLQEIALGGIDTTTRTKTIWQARLLPVDHGLADPEPAKSQWDDFKKLQKRRGRLQAKCSCKILENQLYRVEVHAVNNNSVTLKWAPDNASTIVPITSIKYQSQLAGEGTGETWTFAVGDLPISVRIGDRLELEDDSSRLSGRPWPLAEVTDIDRQAQEITIKVDTENYTEAASLADGLDLSQHPVLRRWEKELVVRPQSDPGSDSDWTELNSAVKVRLVAASGDWQNEFHPGDYWWIPVRADPAPNGEIIWHDDAGKGLRPHGIEHHYAPLALLYWGEESGWQAEDWRPEFFPLVDMVRQLEAYQKTTSEKLQSLRNEAEQRLDQFSTRLEELESMITGGVEAALKRAVNRTSLQYDFRATDELDKGHVVALSVAHKADVEKRAEQLVSLASSAEPSLILGVVSQAPSFRTAESRYTVTIYGRATCLVTGRVDPGDLLVPSDQPGVARRAGLYIRRGSVIGKALSSHAPNPEAPDLNGEINILVMLG